MPNISQTQATYLFFQHHGPMKVTDFAAKAEIKPDTARKRVNSAVEQGLLELAKTTEPYLIYQATEKE